MRGKACEAAFQFTVATSDLQESRFLAACLDHCAWRWGGGCCVQQYLGNSTSSSLRWGTWGTGELSKCRSVRNTWAAWARNRSIFSLACWATRHMTCSQLQTKGSTVSP